MKAFVVEKYAPNKPLVLREVPDPVPGANEILVQIYASAVNLLDSHIRDGAFKLFLPYKTPVIVGHDMAGVVKAVGPRVTKFKVGDEVYSRPRDFHQGTFAEKIAVHEDDVALKPKNATLTEAASLPLVGLTAWQALVEIAQLQSGQKVFIQAGSGGVGTFAIQLAKHLGAYVATTTSAKNAELVRALGADEVIDYKTQDFAKVLADYDVVLHSQDSAALLKSIEILKPGGKLVSISGPPDPGFASKQKLNPIFKLVFHVLSRKVRKAAARKNVLYSFLFMRASGNQLRSIADLVDRSVIKPVIAARYPFEKTSEALDYVKSGRAAGKVVIEMPST